MKIANIKKLLVKIGKHSSAGTTLVELLLYMGILSVFLVTLTSLFFLILGNQSRSLAITSLEENSKFISARIQYDLKRASSVSLPAAVGNTSSSLQLVIGGQTYTYSVVGGVMQLTTPSATENVHGGDVSTSTFQVTRQGNSGGNHTFKVNYSLDSTQLVAGEAKSRTYQLVVGSR